MAYGTARLRAFYGAGDYSTGLALHQAQLGYVPGYYPAGGWLSKLGKWAGGAVSKVAPVVKGLAAGPIGKLATGLGGKLVRGLPILGTALAAYDIGKAAVGAFRGGKMPARTVTAGPAGLGVSFAPQSPIEKAHAVGRAARGVHRAAKHVRRRVRRAVAAHRARRRGRGRRGDYFGAYQEGDVRRARSGRFLTGHRFPKRRHHRRRSRR